MAREMRPLEAFDSAAAFFGARLRHLRLELGLSQDGLAAQVHVSGDLLSKIERAVRRPASDLVERLDDVLGADGALLAVAASMRDEADAASAHLSPPSGPAATVGVGSELVAGLEMVLTGLRQVDHSLGSGMIVASALAQGTLAEGLLPVAQGAARRGLLRVLAQTYQLAGWSQFDHAQSGAAETSFRRAREFAVQTRDPALLAYVLGPSQGFAATYSGNPMLGLGLAEQATDAARRSGNRRLMAFTLTIQARALARLGEEARCHQQLDAAAKMLALHASPDGDPDWLQVFDDAALRGHRGSCELDLRQPQRAVVSISEQHASAPQAYVRNRTMWLLDRADAHAALEEPEAAAADVSLAWTAAAGTSSRRTATRLRTSVARLDRWSQVRAVAEMRELVGT